MPLFKRARDDEGRYIVLGLGNPGERYARTRHNAGAMVLEELLRRAGASMKRHRTGALVAETRLAGAPVVLARSTTYMNESGRAAQALLRFYRSGPERLIVVHDEIDIPFGDVRVKLGGGTAGHNGLRSVGASIQTKDFVRVRVGVGRPPGSREAADHVLDNFNSSERRELPALIDEAADAVERIIEAGTERAMTEFNARSR